MPWNGRLYLVNRCGGHGEIESRGQCICKKQGMRKDSSDSRGSQSLSTYSRLLFLLNSGLREDGHLCVSLHIACHPDMAELGHLVHGDCSVIQLQLIYCSFSTQHITIISLMLVLTHEAPSQYHSANLCQRDCNDLRRQLIITYSTAF